MSVCGEVINRPTEQCFSITVTLNETDIMPCASCVIKRHSCIMVLRTCFVDVVELCVEIRVGGVGITTQYFIIVPH